MAARPADSADDSADVRQLRDEVQRLRRELTSKHQDLMDLRGRMK